MGWQIINSESLWQEVVYFKYIHPLSIMEWIHKPSQSSLEASNIWKAISQPLSLIKDGLAWKIGNGEQVRLGIDAWIECDNAHILPRALR